MADDLMRENGWIPDETINADYNDSLRWLWEHENG